IMAIENEAVETDTSRPWMGWLKGLGWAVLMLALLVIVRLIWDRGTMASKLQETLAELDRIEPGWRLEDIEAAREQIPEEENSARTVIEAASLLPHEWPSQKFAERFAHLAPQEQLAPDDLTQLQQELLRLRPALDAAGKLADMPRGRHYLHYERNPIQ